MNRRSLRALARRLGYEDSPLAREGRAVIREMRAQADHIREGSHALVWDLLSENMPKGEGPPRRLRHGDGEQLVAWSATHATREAHAHVNATLRAVAGRLMAEAEAEMRAEREARAAAAGAAH